MYSSGICRGKQGVKMNFFFVNEVSNFVSQEVFIFLVFFHFWLHLFCLLGGYSTQTIASLIFIFIPRAIVTFLRCVFIFLFPRQILILIAE